MKRKPLPLSCEDFKRVITRNQYYVDKTGLIKELIDKESQLVLFTRPRRFGKTLNQSMLKYFFEKTEEDNSGLFDELEISGYDGRYMAEQGQYPVIFISFKDLKHSSFDDVYGMFKMIISKEFKRHLPVLNVSGLLASDMKMINSIIDLSASTIDYKSALGFLSDCLYKVYNKKVIILIDEYDVPLENAHFCGFYNEMVDLIRSCFSVALKTNDSLHLGVLTGCLRVSKESIFTGFNNPDIYGVTNNDFSDCFGFTNDEVAEMLEYYGLQESACEVKEWYDGYIFGVENIYNPFSLVSYIAKKIAGEPRAARPYWSNSSSNSIICELVTKCNDTTKDYLEQLMNGETISKPIYEDLTYGDIGRLNAVKTFDDEHTINSEQIWSHLLFTGYLKQRISETDDSAYDLQIPNREVMETYTKIIKDVFQDRIDSSSRDDLFKAVLNGDEDTINMIINDWLYDSISYHDEKESFYHGTIYGMLSGFKGYKLESNREAGSGRFDLMLYDARRRSIGICFEFKIADVPEEIDAKIEEALNQIQEKDYTQYFRTRDISNIIRYGAVFCGKRCKLKAQIEKK